MESGDPVMDPFLFEISVKKLRKGDVYPKMIRSYHIIPANNLAPFSEKDKTALKKFDFAVLVM